MKTLILLPLFVLLLSYSGVCQTDSLAVEQEVLQDTVVEESSAKKEHKRVSDFKIYGGVSTSKFVLSNSNYESAYAAGYLLGFSYRKGRFGYWEIGLNYNNSIVTLDDINALSDNMHIRQLELPLSVGINILSVTRRVLGVRLFGGVVPGYIVGISDNPFSLEKDDFNRFQFAGRGGVGVDVFFLVIELGYQHGFIDALTDQGSKLSQGDFRLGFRF